MPDNLTVTIEDARLIYKNFEGRESKYKPEGTRTFCAVIDDIKKAEQLKQDNWNVKFPDPREDGETRDPYLPIAVGYKIRPPRIVIITEDGAKTTLAENDIALLDWCEMKSCDLVARQAFWELNGDTGYKAWLQTLVVQISEDPLERKYKLNEKKDSGASLEAADD